MTLAPKQACHYVAAVGMRLHLLGPDDPVVRTSMKAAFMTHPPTRPHILVMNDSPDVMALFEDLLTEEGYRVTTMPFLEKDLDKIVAFAPDGIILDYMWPQED